MICGVHQNVYAEVNLPFLKAHQIDLVRRNSGGGAVYVDPGNLTYCYIDTEATIQHPRFAQYAQPIIQVLRHLGVNAVMSGRNDLTVDGKKFSGMSASKMGHRVSYGGTLMIDVNLENATRALTPSKAKLTAKGVKSVHSRVTNLRPYFKASMADLSFEQLKKMILLAVFQKERLDQIPTYRLTTADWQAVAKLADQKYGTKKWIYGDESTFQYHCEHYFKGVGTISIDFSVSDGQITKLKIYGDFLQTGGGLPQLERQLQGCNYSREALAQAFRRVSLQKIIGNISAESLANMMLTASSKTEA